MKTKRNLVYGIVCGVLFISLLACNAVAAENDLSVYGDALTVYIENPLQELGRADGFGSLDCSIYGGFVTECLKSSDRTPFFHAYFGLKNMSVWGHSISNLMYDN